MKRMVGFGGEGGERSRSEFIMLELVLRLFAERDVPSRLIRPSSRLAIFSSKLRV